MDVTERAGNNSRNKPPSRRGGGARGRPPVRPAGWAARFVAALTVRSILAARIPLDEALGQSLAELAANHPRERLDERDRALARAIATVAMRHLGSIRALLAPMLTRGLPKKSGLLEASLLTAAAQIRFMDVPDHAAVDLAVGIVKDDPHGQPFGALANAVLRRLVREKDASAAIDPVEADTPAWLRERWTARYGGEAARAIAAAHGREAGIDLTVKADAAGWAERLDAVLLPTGSLRLRTTAAPATLAGYAEGAWWVQDAAAAVPARLLSPAPGERIADLCAAPGGKTAQLAAAGADVTAIDRSPERLTRVAENMQRLGLSATLVAADALAFTADPFDAVLLDAPCSATGTIRRNPDVAWTKRPEDVARLAELQRALLDRAATLVKPGGRLVYCTCSLEPEEGEAQVDAFLARHPEFARMPAVAADLGLPPEAATPAGDIRTLPSMWPAGHGGPEDGSGNRLAGLDGFFAARLQRRAGP